MRDRTAFDILIRENAAMLTAFLRSLTNDDDLVEEAFQQAVIDAWKTLPTFDRTRPFAPWLRGIGRHRLLAIGRAKGRRQRNLEAFEDLVAARFRGLDRLTGDTFTERLSALRECIERLPDGQQSVIDLVYMREHDTRSAATALGIDWETMRKRLQRARMALADCMRGKGIFDAGGERDEHERGTGATA